MYTLETKEPYSLLNEPLIQQLLSLELPPEDYAIFGSGPMSAHRLKDFGHDLDLIARGAAWDKATELAQPEIAGLGGNVIKINDGAIEIFDGWAPGEWDINELINNADEIEGIRFVKLEEVLRWKVLMDRSKDKMHIQILKAFLNRNWI